VKGEKRKEAPLFLKLGTKEEGEKGTDVIKKKKEMILAHDP